MTLQAQGWEHRLLAWAYEALTTINEHKPFTVNDSTLERAYRRAAAITREHSRTFYTASGLLPTAKRRAARALYAFCRITDDIVDTAAATDNCRIELEVWRSTSAHALPNADPVVLAWADARARYGIPSAYADQLIDGVARDLRQNRYPTFAELAEYAYGVASTVGLMAMHITGFAGRDAIPYAVKLGVALQLTNILRDVGEDWRHGRVYLPQDELAAFNLSDDAIAAGEVTANWRDFMRFQIARAQQLYADSWPGIAMLDPDGRFAIGAAAALYRGILEDIKDHDYDVFSRRAHVGALGKLRRLPGIWLRTR